MTDKPIPVSPKEYEVLLLRSLGLPFDAIASTIKRTNPAVGNRLASARAKCGVKTNAEMIDLFKAGRIVELRHTPDIALPSQSVNSSTEVPFAHPDYTNRQQAGRSTRPSPVAGRAGDAQSQDGIAPAADPIRAER